MNLGPLLDPEERKKLSLTFKETDVLDCLLKSDARRDVAQKMGMSIETVYKHIQNIRRKYRARR